MKTMKITLAGANTEPVQKVAKMLSEVGVEDLFIANTNTDTFENLKTQKPDFLILDLELTENYNGLELANWTNINHPIPFVFLAKEYPLNGLQEILQTRPMGFLVDPISPLDLYSTLKSAHLQYTCTNLLRHQQRKALSTDPDYCLNNCVFIKDGNSHVRVDFKTVNYIESNENYVKIYFQNNMHPITVRSTMNEVLELLPEGNFVRISRRHIVQIEGIDKITPKAVSLGTKTIALGEAYKGNVYKALGI